MSVTPAFELGLWNAWSIQVFVLYAIGWMISWFFGAIEKKRFLIEKYGNAFREYMDRSPRRIEIPELKKSDWYAFS